MSEKKSPGKSILNEFNCKAKSKFNTSNWGIGYLFLMEINSKTIIYSKEK